MIDVNIPELYDKETHIVRAALIPVYLLDVMDSLYVRNIQGLQCRHMINKYKNDWHKQYVTFTSSCIATFDNDSQQIVIDFMDEFDAYINNSIMVLMSQVMMYLAKFDIQSFEVRKVLGAAFTGNVLAQMAQVFCNKMGCFDAARAITPIIFNSRKFMQEYYRIASDIDCEKSPEIMASFDALVKKCIDFIEVKHDDDTVQNARPVLPSADAMRIEG